MILSCRRLDRPARNFPSREDRNDVPDFTGRIASGHGRLSSPVQRVVVGDLHDADFLGDNPAALIDERLSRRSWLFRLDDALDLHDFPADGIRAADILALKLGVELITLLASGANDSDVHGWVPPKQGNKTNYLF